MLIKTSDTRSVKSIFNQLKLPQPNSHKGQNGRVLIIGGSSLFHSASLWAAEVASHFCDMVHYSSTEENQEIFLSLKKKFHNGIIVPQEKLMDYVKEDDVILVGSGMMREGAEAKYTFDLTRSLIKNFPEKKFVFDAGALQVMEPDWLLKLKTSAIITPHQKEFEKLFNVSIHQISVEEKIKLVQAMAKKYKIIILLKAIIDIISDGNEVYLVEGGNAGLTKGGTGDILAGLTTTLSSNNSALTSAVTASLLLKKTGEKLFRSKGYWYNVDNIIEMIPEVLNEIIL
ncbi:NAD(P)H-hydrate dehydratase [Candidatus Roizmanbacteria bacterium CG_4_9_14_3_um_filter_33_18]|uniref:ADP-dependent (S)-NAD(P)H-hydrate dehydratase n=3 Tax=Candidatus Roizmaniibacteriota TaxID=1752723 RepID=A0A2M7XX52_9BACT|nr:MAG: NAD(P)H-hydrate dehydratase [Candidatus Roizmanbacteria bacterium CG22_combo_CG10-13_8_21_14_all_34_12]PJA55298.1 MAG: NAD(P)H-hydrate dehydratase [Candidatus Roizmanbacteria bacterium CG_4_9_14_3_um_filter_33_18]